MEITEWAKLQEEMLKAQLSVVRGYMRGKGGESTERKASSSKRKSQMNMITDILIEAGKPLHAMEIIERVDRKYGIKLDRESMVSALTKKVKKGTGFVRTGPNVFALKAQ